MAAAIVVLLRHSKTLDRRSRHGVIVSAAWFIGAMLICAISHYKLPHYALSANPPLMLLTGLALDRALRADLSRRLMAAAIVVTAIAFVAAGGAIVVALFWLPTTFRAAAVVIAGALAIGGIASVALMRRRDIFPAAALTTATAVAYGAAAVLLLPGPASGAYPYPALGRLVAENAPPRVSLGSIGAHTALVYYADRPVTFLATPPEAARFLNSHEPRLVVRNCSSETLRLWPSTPGGNPC